jgi:hypothetical protein
MTAQAQAAQATAQAIIAAARTLFAERPYDLVSLPLIAERSGVTVQTVLRRFGSKEDPQRLAYGRQVRRRECGGGQEQQDKQPDLISAADQHPKQPPPGKPAVVGGPPPLPPLRPERWHSLPADRSVFT